uniref:Neur_chan_memb domain-containing protein n=1 Tax=Steinernema glaseri TaxID=37863 RepID=A0A1I7YRI5_9BILA
MANEVVCCCLGMMPAKKATSFVALFCITLGLITTIPLSHLQYSVPNDFLLAGLDLLLIFTALMLLVGIYADTPHLLLPFFLV